MRGLRPILLFIASAALLCGQTGAALAQEKDLTSGDWLAPTEGVFFAGGDCSMDTAAAERTALPSGGGFETRGLPITCEVEFGDPRLSGTQTIVDNTDCFQKGGCIHWGTVDITSADGSWGGWFSGTEYPDTRTDLYIVLSGAGAYEGLTSIRHAQGSFWEALDQVGLVYEGPPPPIAPIE